MKLLMVEWCDICSGNHWQRREEHECTESIVSLGILVREDDWEIELAPNLGHAEKLHQIAIPKGAIKRIRRIYVR